MTGHERFDGRALVRYAARAHHSRIRAELLLVEFELVVLHDRCTAALGVIEQPPIVGAQIAAALVSADAGDDDVVLGEIAPGELVLIDEGELGTELLDCRRHLVAGAGNVADGHIRHRLDVDDFDRDLGRFDHLAPLDVRVFDLLITVRECRPACGRRRDRRGERVLAGFDARRRRHLKAHSQRFVFVREGDRGARGRRFPSGRRLERDRRIGGALRVVGHRHVHFARRAGRR